MASIRPDTKIGVGPGYKIGDSDPAQPASTATTQNRHGPSHSGCTEVNLIELSKGNAVPSIWRRFFCAFLLGQNLGQNPLFHHQEMAETLVFFDRPKEPRVGFEPSVPLAKEARAQAWNSSIEVTHRLLRA